MKHVCILGCGRSGTSIFGELFEHLPAYSYYSEPDYHTLAAFDYSKPIAIKVPRPAANQRTSPGLPFLLEEFLDVFPEPRIIFWQVRHPLDTICSLRVGISKNWGHHPRPHDWQEWLDRPLLEQCAHHWNYLNTVGFQQVQYIVHINRFEEMILQPLQTAHRICQLAGIDIEQNDAAIRAWAKRVQNENNQHFVEAETSRPYSRPDHVKKVGRWKENLSEAEANTLWKMVKEAANGFKYSP